MMIDEKKMYQLTITLFMIALFLIALTFLYLIIFTLGFETQNASAVIIFLSSYLFAASWFAVTIENSTKRYQNRWLRIAVATILNLALDLLLVIGLNEGITGITLSNAAILGLTFFTYVGMKVFIFWVEID
ncbi:MAG: hypothetical protein ACRC17_03640 [Culicoidibacterales bacterium]